MRILDVDADVIIPDITHKRNMAQKFMGLRFKTGRAWFSFRWPTRAAIDMLFVPEPLDIAFIDDEMEIIEIHGAFPVTTQPTTWRVYRPKKRYKYALEVEKGLLSEKGVEEGHTVKVLD